MLFLPLRSSHNTFALPLRTPFGRGLRVCALRIVGASFLDPVLTLLPVPPRCFAAVSDLNIVSNHSLGTVLIDQCSLLRRACANVCGLGVCFVVRFFVAALRRHLPREPSGADRVGSGRRNGAKRSFCGALRRRVCAQRWHKLSEIRKCPLPA